jgi:exodeoxyribonuclease VII large subunit
MTQDGLGDLYREFERLKKKLSEEGLFNQEFKKPIPRYPERIGVITAPTGAAVRDIINIASRRFPLAEIVIYPALVQGVGAKESIVKGIEYFNREKNVDTLIVGRGGGSIEDLWAFNEECVARAIFASQLPIISAVGHETDFTIADFVADLRAPTPSAAAEISVPSQMELTKLISIYSSRMYGAIHNYINFIRTKLERLTPRHPQDKINELYQLLDMRLHSLETNYKLRLSEKGAALGMLASKLDALSPLQTLARGYSIPVKADGTVLRNKSDFNSCDEFLLKLKDGDVECITK